MIEAVWGGEKPLKIYSGLQAKMWILLSANLINLEQLEENRDSGTLFARRVSLFFFSFSDALKARHEHAFLAYGAERERATSIANDSCPYNRDTTVLEDITWVAGDLSNACKNQRSAITMSAGHRGYLVQSYIQHICKIPPQPLVGTPALGIPIPR